jgi:PAS domain S-box-containing protein
MTGVCRVVHLHDDTSSEAVLTLADRPAFEVVTAADVAVACDRLEADGADCVVVECANRSQWAARALREIRAVAPDVPCVLFCPETRVPAELVSLDVSAVVPWTDDAPAGDDAVTALVREVSEAVDEYRAATARQRKRARLSTFVTESTDVLSVVDRDGRFTYVSPAVTRLLGHDPADLVGTDSADYVHPDDRERAMADLERLFDSPDGELSDELRLRHADGSWVWVENRGRNLVDDPSVEGLVIYSRDISARKRRERRLRQYQSIVESMSDVAYTVDESLTITYANDRALAYAELPREAVVGQSLRELSAAMLVEEEQVDRFVAALERVIAGESDTEQLELDIDLPGGVVFAGIRITPLRPHSEGSEANDARAGAVVISRDITERIEYERTLERQNERLDTFSSVVSHDLRGPLSVASGSLELARMACRDEDLDAVEERLAAVGQAHTRMERLIDDLLTVARQGTRVERLAAVDLDAIARASWAFVDSGTTTLDVDTGLVVRADEARLRQLFENLLRNSVEHGSTTHRSQARVDRAHHGSTNPQSRTGEAAAHEVAADGEDVAGAQRDGQSAESSVHIRVGALADGAGFFIEDDGPGIPADVRETVFEGGYSTKSDGTGFGLMIVREIADAHDWDVTATTGSGGGARFEVRNVQVASK